MRLLLVEDNAGLSTWLAKLLRSEHYVVDCVPDGETAIDGTDLNIYDLAIVDLGLPGISGQDLIRQLRAKCFAMPIMILTAEDKLSTRVEGLNIGADDYMTKPFELEELDARLKALLRRAKLPWRRNCASALWHSISPHATSQLMASLFGIRTRARSA